MSQRRQTLVQSQTALGRALRDARRSEALSQQDLADLAGVSQSTVSNVERGISRVGIDTVLRLLAALQIEMLIQRREVRDISSAWQDRR